jgi:hypothetical protein
VTCVCEQLGLQYIGLQGSIKLCRLCVGGWRVGPGGLGALAAGSTTALGQWLAPSTIWVGCGHAAVLLGALHPLLQSQCLSSLCCVCVLSCVQLPPGGGAFQEDLVVRQVMRRVTAGETHKQRGGRGRDEAGDAMMHCRCWQQWH